jgi:exopolysaccharide biosynthesis polyprenyl glycosylphosphotransferase
MSEQRLEDGAAGPPPESPSAESRPALPWLRKLNERGFRLVMLADLVGLYSVMVLAMFYRFGTSWPSYPTTLYLISFAFIATIFITTLYFGGLYEREPRLGAPPVLPRAGRQTLAAGGLVALLSMGTTGLAREIGLTTERALPLPFLNLGALIILGACVVAINRQLVHWARTRREGPPRVALIGGPASLGLARSHLQNAASDATIVAEIEDPADVLDVVEASGATDVLVLDGDLLEELYPTPLQDLERQGLSLLLRVTAQETMYGLQRVRQVGGMPFVVLRAQTMPRSRERFKRLFDLVLLALALPAWLGLLGVIALYQLIAARPPLMYRQVRVGQYGRHFNILKFRTMVVDAEEDGRGARLADVGDPRVIPACRWIRAMRMDELPQLINVLRGEMSLVGPRPERPELAAAFEEQIPGYARRNELRPGLTGLAQIHGRYHTDAEYKLGYDLQYLVNWSPVLDLEILVRTVWVVLARKI